MRESGSSPYKLRGEARLPARYRDAAESPPQPSSSSTRSPRRSSNNLPASKSRLKTVSSSPIKRPAAAPAPTRHREAVAAETATEIVDSQSSSSIHSRAPTSSSVTTSPFKRRLTGPYTDTVNLPLKLRNELRHLKNILKLPKARRWVYCEFFYSPLDEQLLCNDDEFNALLRDALPNVRARQLTRPEWRTVRRLIGRPRRCSAAFLEEERAALQEKRRKVAELWEGNATDIDISDLPLRIPCPLSVGQKVFARVRDTRDGVYSGTIDAILGHSFRIVFDKEDLLQPSLVSDIDVMLCDTKPDLVAPAYFADQMRLASIRGGPVLNPIRTLDAAATSSTGGKAETRVGNFPLRMLVLLVKLAKFIETKRGLLQQLNELNSHIEKSRMLTDDCTHEMKERYAQVVVDLETLNRHIASYTHGVDEYNSQLQPLLGQNKVISRPETLRRVCNTHAAQIVKHVNSSVRVRNHRSLGLVTQLVSLMLQIRSLGHEQCTPWQLSAIQESLTEIRTNLAPSSRALFLDQVEVHIKEMHDRMLLSTAATAR